MNHISLIGRSILRYNEAFVSVSLNYQAIELREILLFVVVVYFTKAADVFGFCPKLVPLYLAMAAMKFSNRKSVVFLLGARICWPIKSKLVITHCAETEEIGHLSFVLFSEIDWRWINAIINGQETRMFLGFLKRQLLCAFICLTSTEMTNVQC